MLGAYMNTWASDMIEYGSGIIKLSNAALHMK